MKGRIPFIPTLVVAMAVLTMIGLGIWQLGRAQYKEQLLAGYAEAQTMPELSYPAMVVAGRLPLFRRALGNCLEVTDWRQVAGESAKGQIGYAFLAQCRTGIEGPGMVVDAGWSANPQTKPSWKGGEVRGMISPDKQALIRLVSAAGLGGLEASAPPSPAMIPNNHRSYAVQWFAFAAVALIIYVLALARRSRDKAA